NRLHRATLPSRRETAGVGVWRRHPQPLARILCEIRLQHAEPPDRDHHHLDPPRPRKISPPVAPCQNCGPSQNIGCPSSSGWESSSPPPATGCLSSTPRASSGRSCVGSSLISPANP